MRFIGKSPSAARPARAARVFFIQRLRGFGARIRQRLGLVTHPSGFLAVFGGWFWPPTNLAPAPVSGPQIRPAARPRPWRDRRTAGFRGSGGLRTPAGGYIADIPAIR